MGSAASNPNLVVEAFFQPPSNGPHNAFGQVTIKYKPWKVVADNITNRLQSGIKQRQFRYKPPTDFEPASGCSKTLDVSHTCGAAPSVIQAIQNFGNASTDEVLFDCETQATACENYRFEVTNQGFVLFTHRGGRSINEHFNSGSLANTSEGQNQDQPKNHIAEINQMVLNDTLPSTMNFKRKYVRYMYPGQSLGPGEYICSGTGNCFFGLDPADSKFKMFTIKIRSNKRSITVKGGSVDVMEGLNDLGTNISGALYELNGVDVKNFNKVANISIDGKRRMFESNIGRMNTLELGTKYTEIIGTEPSGRTITYDNPGNDLESIINKSGDISYCFDRCSARPDCGGFVVDSNDPDKCFLKDKDIFPNSNRVREIDKKLYKRLYTPRNISESCMKSENKDVVAIDSILLDHYPLDENNTRMGKNTLCGSDQLLADPTKKLSDIQIGAIDSFLTRITNNLTKAFKVMTQYDTIQNGDEMNVTGRMDAYDKINTKIKSILKKQDTIDGLEEDTYIQVVSETYKYIIWSIIAVVIIMVIVVYGDVSNYTTNITTSTFGNFFKSSSSSSQDQSEE